MALSLKQYTGRYNSQGYNGNVIRFLIDRDKKERERSSAITITVNVGDNLPENLIIEILSWLPVKSLLQFKSVCRSWYTIISSPHFISKHLGNYYDNNDNMDCYLTYEITSYAETLVYARLFEESGESVVSEPLYELHNTAICGPCNGIFYRYRHYENERSLWNPATNELKLLPPLIMKSDLPADLRHDGHEVYGFGLDPLTKDYKIVVIHGYESKRDRVDTYDPQSVFVYSLSTDSWKYCGDLSQRYYLENYARYIFVNGCLYWSGFLSNGEPEVIISFNITVDELQEIQEPSHDFNQDYSTSLGVYGESLAFYVVYPPREEERHFDIWTYNEGIWTKKISIGPMHGLWHPIGHLKDDKAILKLDDGNKLVLCDKLWKICKIASPIRLAGVFCYMESLVSIKDLSKHAP